MTSSNRSIPATEPSSDLTSIVFVTVVIPVLTRPSALVETAAPLSSPLNSGAVTVSSALILPPTVALPVAAAMLNLVPLIVRSPVRSSEESRVARPVTFSVESVVLPTTSKVLSSVAAPVTSRVSPVATGPFREVAPLTAMIPLI